MLKLIIELVTLFYIFASFVFAFDVAIFFNRRYETYTKLMAKKKRAKEKFKLALVTGAFACLGVLALILIGATK